MRQLVWKEYREKRWWFVLLAVYPLACVLTNRSYGFLGLKSPAMLHEVLVSGLIALLMGLAAYAPELGGGTTDFLYAKPAGWKRVLGAKLGIALAFFALSAILAAVAFRLVCPEPYLRFAGFTPLARGAGFATVVMLGGYLLGLCCSVALPGMLGSVLTLGSAFAVLTAAVVIIQAFVGPVASIAVALMIGSAVAVLAAGLTVTRFGLTLSLGARVRRYALVFLAVLPLGALAALACGPLLFRPQVQKSTAFWSFSPSGRYALKLTAEQPYLSRIYRLSDGANARLPWKGLQPWSVGWTPSDKLFALYRRDELKPNPVVVRLVWLDRDARRRVQEMNCGSALHSSSYLSPSGSKALVVLYTPPPGPPDPKKRLAVRYRVVDLVSFRVLPVAFPSEANVSWVSDSRIAVRTSSGAKPVCVRVGP